MGGLAGRDETRAMESLFQFLLFLTFFSASWTIISLLTFRYAILFHNALKYYFLER
jgi:hypothetical protein